MQTQINGSVAAGFEPVKARFEALWEEVEVGASLAVYQDGEPIINLWGGYVDRNQSRVWQRDTLVNVYSATKGLAAVTFGLLVQDGLVRYDDLVIKYWPEFGAHGKQNVTVAQLLSHQAGVCAVDEVLEVSDLYQQDQMASRLAAQKPFWTPGEDAGYHAVTWGFLVAELIIRISGETIGRLFHNRLAVPLGLETYIGVPEALHSRCAELIGPNHARKIPAAPQTSRPAPSEIYVKTLLNPPISPFKHASSAAWRSAEIPASNGHSNADGLAKLYSLLVANTGILDPAILQEATRLEVDQQIDLVMGTVIRRSRGFIMSSDNNYGPAVKAFGHAGAGGSMAFADPERKIGFAYVMNQMQSDSLRPNRADTLIAELYTCF